MNHSEVQRELSQAVTPPHHSDARIALGPGYLPPAYLPPALPRWTGCYVGGNIGGAWAKIDESSIAGGTVSPHPAGVAGGGQIGCDVQFAEWVFGIRDMLDATSLRSSTSFPVGSATSRANWFDTLTAREGYLVQPNVLLYVQAARPGPIPK